jgi:hypothetical protein
VIVVDPLPGENENIPSALVAKYLVDEERPIAEEVTLACDVNLTVRGDQVTPLSVDMTTLLANDASTMEPSVDVEILSQN